MFHIICNSNRLCTGGSSEVPHRCFDSKSILLLVAYLWVGPQMFLHCFTLITDCYWKGLLTAADWNQLKLTIASHGREKLIYLKSSEFNLKLPGAIFYHVCSLQKFEPQKVN